MSKAEKFSLILRIIENIRNHGEKSPSYDMLNSLSINELEELRYQKCKQYNAIAYVEKIALASK